MGGRNVPQCRLGLDTHEVEVVVHGVKSTRGIGNLPDDNGSDLHGIAVSVVDLQVVRLEVPDPNAHTPPVRERQDPPKASSAHGADIASEESHDLGLAGLHDDQRAQNDGRHDDWRGDDALDGTVGEEICANDAAGDDEDAEPAADGPRSALLDLDADSRMTDRSRLGFAVGWYRLAHDPS